MSEKVSSLAYQAMCLFNEFDMQSKRGLELASEEWDDKGARWQEIVMFLSEDITTEPPPCDGGISVVGNVKVLD